MTKIKIKIFRAVYIHCFNLQKTVMYFLSCINEPNILLLLTLNVLNDLTLK